MTVEAETRTGLTADANNEHAADRSSWDCRVCDQPWPCAPAKVALPEEFQEHPSLLIMFLVATFYEARDAYTPPNDPPDLFERIVMWAVRSMNS